MKSTTNVYKHDNSMHDKLIWFLICGVYDVEMTSDDISTHKNTHSSFSSEIWHKKTDDTVIQIDPTCSFKIT